MTNSEAIYKCLENSVSETAAPIKLFSVDDSKGFCIEIFLNITYSSTASFADLMFMNNATDASFKFGYCPYAKIENGYSIEIWKTTSSNITTYYAALTASSALTTALSATWNIRKELKYGNYTELYSSAESVTIPASTDDNAYTTLSGANKNFIMDSDLNVTNVKATGNISANDFNATEKLTVGTDTSKTTIDSTGISTNSGTITANKFSGNGEDITKISFKNLPNMYCGNLKVSTTSDSETSPEFSKITVGAIASDTIAGVTKNVLYGNIGNASDIIDDSNDYYRLRIGGESDAGYVSLETVDCITTTTNYLAIKTQAYNNLKPISVAQYYYVNDTTGSTTTSVPETEYKRAYLLDKKGNTSFPGSLTVNGQLNAGLINLKNSTAEAIPNSTTSSTTNFIKFTGGDNYSTNSSSPTQINLSDFFTLGNNGKFKAFSICTDKYLAFYGPNDDTTLAPSSVTCINANTVSHNFFRANHMYIIIPASGHDSCSNFHYFTSDTGSMSNLQRSGFLLAFSNVVYDNLDTSINSNFTNIVNGTLSSDTNYKDDNITASYLTLLQPESSVAGIRAKYLMGGDSTISEYDPIYRGILFIDLGWIPVIYCNNEYIDGFNRFFYSIDAGNPNTDKFKGLDLSNILIDIK